MSKPWLIPEAATACDEAARRWRVPRIVAQLLLNRGLGVDQPGDSFLTPRLQDLYPPHLLPGASDAAAMIVAAIHAKTRIVIYGDYDVDGVAGAAILWHVLHRSGAAVSVYIPHRIEEGYGLNGDAVKRLVADGAGLVISVDCGITAVDVAEALRESDVQLIITDHHTPGTTLPQADVIVHPAVGGVYPNPDLCGAGVAFKLAWAVAQRLSDSERVSPDLRMLLTHLLPLAALGTIADVVPLRGENRIIARHGLQAIAQSPLPGFRALLESAGLCGTNVSGNDVGFKLAPRINAAGRMGHARLAVELFTTAGPDRAREIALYLEGQNRARRATERTIFQKACEIVERDGLAGDARRAIVLAHDGWHAGVVGIVAARLVERYHRPTVLIALSGGEGQGSARSIQHLDLSTALAGCAEHLISYGGHAMAAGLRIALDRVPAFTEAFVQTANSRLTGADLIPTLKLDAQVALLELDLPTARAIMDLGPFGIGNPRPVLATDWVDLASEPRCVGRNNEHLQASFTHGGTSMKGIGFRMAEHIEDLKQHRRCRVAFEPIINDFNGRRTVEMQIVDFKFPS